jgi:hypothetical protein
MIVVKVGMIQFERILAVTAIFFLFGVLLIPGLFFPPCSFSQDIVQPSGEAGNAGKSRGAIPEALLRPQRGESPRYPIDMVIGSLGKGDAPDEAYRLACAIMAALVGGDMKSPDLSGINSVIREGFLSQLEAINSRSYRIGSGREESDGAVSFLIRFIGREQAITGELYVRLFEEAAPEKTAPADTGTEGELPMDTSVSADVPAVSDAGDTPAPEEVIPVVPVTVPRAAKPVWIFDDLILEDPQDRSLETDEHRFDFYPYQRFF